MYSISCRSSQGPSTIRVSRITIRRGRKLRAHYTDWTIGHVHAGALGWVAMISIGSLYHLIPKVFGRPQMHSIGLINAHFWLATIGTVLYMRCCTSSTTCRCR